MPDAFPDFKPRTEFNHGLTLNWYKPHMHKALVPIDEWSKKIDLVVEVRDARAPLSTSQYHLMKRLPSHIRRYIVLNKADLVAPEDALSAKQLLEAQGAKVFLTSAQFNKGVDNVRRELCKEVSPRFSTHGLWMMMVGLPNVGKSTFISALKHVSFERAYHTRAERELAFPTDGKAFKNTRPDVGANPGVTKLVQHYQISFRPRMYCVDTPGVFFQQSDDQRAALKAALLGAVDPHKADARRTGHVLTELADFLLFELNRRHLYHYVRVFELSAPTNDIGLLAAQISQVAQAKSFGGRGSSGTSPMHLDNALVLFLKLYRNGHLGHFVLDEEALQLHRRSAVRGAEGASDGGASLGSLVDPLTLPAEPPCPWDEREYAHVNPGLVSARLAALASAKATGAPASPVQVDGLAVKVNQLRGNEGRRLHRWSAGAKKR